MHPVRVLVLSTSASVVGLAFLLGFMIATEDLGRANTWELGLLAMSFMLSAAALGILLSNWSEISEWANEDDDEDEGSTS